MYGYTYHTFTQTYLLFFCIIKYIFFFPCVEDNWHRLHATKQAIELIPPCKVQESPVNIFLIRGYSGPLDNQPAIVNSFWVTGLNLCSSGKDFYGQPKQALNPGGFFFLAELLKIVQMLNRKNDSKGKEKS